MFLALFFTFTAFSQNRIDLNLGQPLYNQITGNCYSHTGNDVLTGCYLLKKKTSASIAEPHPLLVAAMTKQNQDRGYLTGGRACEYVENAKKIEGPVCSNDGLESFLMIKNPMGKDHYYQELIDKFDTSLNKIADSMDEDDLNKLDVKELKSESQKLIQSVCELGALGLQSNELNSLLDFSRLVIERTVESKQRTWWDDLQVAGIRMLAGQQLTEARHSRILDRRAEKNLRKSLATIFLKKFYAKLNEACLQSEKEMGFQGVPVDYFSSIQNLNCENVYFEGPKITKADKDLMVDTISEQVKQGLPTPIAACGSLFSGKRPYKVKLSDSTDCLNSDDNHALSIVGLIELPNKHKVFKIKNSWGYDQCEGFMKTVKRCHDDGATGCIDLDKEMSCKEGYYYMSEELLRSQMRGYGKVELK